MADAPNRLELNHDVESRILKSLRARKGVATAGDVSADTGLGYEKVDWALQHMLDLYKSHLDVDDDGNLRYRFDPSFTRRGAIKGRTWAKIKHNAWRGFMAFFKVWTMVMLVGYTVAFVVLILAVGIAAIGASMSNDEGGDIGEVGMLPFILVARFLEYMFWWNILSGSSSRHYGHSRGRRRGGLLGGMGRKPYQKPSKAFYQKIFDYLFGPEQPKADPLAPAKAFADFARSRNGRITAADWASRTGQSLDAADNALSASLGRFRGDVDVSEDGTLVYRFDDLLVTAEEGNIRSRELEPIWRRKVTVPSFTGNKSGANTGISLLNGFNLMMAMAVLFVVQGLPLGAMIGLGWIPLVFSALFFLIPLLRKRGHNRRVKAAELENKRRNALSVVYESAVHNGVAYPVAEAVIPEPFQNSFLLDYKGDILVTDNSETVYKFERLATELEDGRRARENAQDEVVFGKTVFSSDREEKSLDEAEMEEFDRRLARELGGDVFEFEQAQAAYAQAQR